MKNKKTKIYTALCLTVMAIAGNFLVMPKKAMALPIDIPVGGVFLPGVFDIYTPTLACGLIVSVAGPNPGVFTFGVTNFYRYFPMTPMHVGTSMLGLATPIPPCPPLLHTVGSSLN